MNLKEEEKEVLIKKYGMEQGLFNIKNLILFQKNQIENIKNIIE